MAFYFFAALGIWAGAGYAAFTSPLLRHLKANLWTRLYWAAWGPLFLVPLVRISWHIRRQRAARDSSEP